jgi:hypothetical protein
MFDISGNSLTVTDFQNGYATLRPSPGHRPFAVETNSDVIFLTREDLRALIDQGEALLEAMKPPADIELFTVLGRRIGVGFDLEGNVGILPKVGCGPCHLDPKSTRTLRDYLTACLEYSA